MNLCKTLLELPPPLLSMVLGALQVGVEQVKLHTSTVSLRCQHMPAHAEENTVVKVSEKHWS